MQSQPHGGHPDRIEAECRDRRESGLIVNFNGQKFEKSPKVGQIVADQIRGTW